MEVKLKEMHQVLDSIKPPNLNQEVVQNLKRPITNEDIYHYTKAIIKYNLKQNANLILHRNRKKILRHIHRRHKTQNNYLRKEQC